jgi:hypothetical protein
MGKTLVLIDNLYRQYGFDGIEKNDILFLPMLKKEYSNKAIRILRKIHLSSNLPGKSVWLGDWENYIDDYNTVILADAGNTFNVIRYIHYRYPSKRIIIWYRNSVSASTSPTEEIKKYCEIWSFDKADCNKFGMRYNPQFYAANKKYKDHIPVYDAYFIGQDKGRLKILMEMEAELKKQGLKTKFCIVGVNSERKSYDTVLEDISKSRIIVDCQCDWQNGITLRPMEALFYHKKLITNNIEVVNADYYRPENIFIWGKDNPLELKQFTYSKYLPVSDEIIDNYDMSGWVRRFNP